MFDLVNALRHSHQYCSQVGTKQMLLGWLLNHYYEKLNALFYDTMTKSGGGVSLNPDRKS